MTEALDTLLAEPESTEHSLTYEALRGRDVHEAERLVDRFADELRKMTAEERVRASRYSMNSYADVCITAGGRGGCMPPATPTRCRS